VSLKLEAERNRLFATAQRISALHKRTGAIYVADPSTGSIDRVHNIPKPMPMFHVPERREPVSRPRERRARARSPGRLGDDDPEPLAPRRCLTAAERRVLKVLIDQRKREAVAARPEINLETYRLFDEDRRS
jgi:hypothetical protein